MLRYTVNSMMRVLFIIDNITMFTQAKAQHDGLLTGALLESILCAYRWPRVIWIIDSSFLGCIVLRCNLIGGRSRWIIFVMQLLSKKPSLENQDDHHAQKDRGVCDVKNWTKEKEILTPYVGNPIGPGVVEQREE